jgi:DNA-binding LacI/PurR family transcriptional regulator
MATLKDIARAADLSISTISRVLNNTATEAGISKETQQRVWRIANEMNYIPNKMARNLKLGRQPKAILFLYSSSAEKDDGLLIHPFFSHMLHGIHLEVTRMRGCYLAYMGSNQRNRRQVAELLDQAVSGVITFGQLTEGVWKELDIRKIPVVSIEPYSLKDRYAVYVDNEMAVMQGLKHLYELGHRRIHFFYLPDSEAGKGPMAERREAFRKGLSALGSNVDGKIVYVDKTSSKDEIDAVCQAAQGILAKDDRPTAILTCHDLCAIGVLEAARRIGLEVPDDLSLVGIDDIDWACYTHPPLTTTHIPKEEMGVQAIAMLRQLLRGKECDPGVVRIPTKLVVRGSTATLDVSS